ncbi:MAG TPA: TIGR03560 family F420-dependent LLM class oxidoreductase [Acidimicrobiales bacterium]|nr:TIGR03560 family F420-dependent LLM class oxidoreductase [Acidimicrobiales bacterium]
MRFSIWPSPMWSWSDILELTRHCEATGWDGVYFADHFMPNGPADASPPEGPTLECWSVIAGLAAAVPRLRLAPLVTSVTYRHPAVLANIAAAVDNISGGRLVLGLGAGWQENEHAAYGLPLGSPKERVDRFEEALQILRSLLRERRTTFAGRYFEVKDAPNQPAPVQQDLPILIGAGGEKRMMRIAARLADEWNSWTTPEVLRHKVEVLHRHCDDVGRDPAAIKVSTQALLFLSSDKDWVESMRGRDVGRAGVVGTPAEVVDVMGSYAAAGADEFIVPGFTLPDLARAKDTCDLFIEEVAPSLR